jgi:peptidoglycan/xylan/chitin deacetylase (PgdA/CDA1 family)
MMNYGISFQSHTCSHPDLTASSNDEALTELVTSKKQIEDTLGIPVNHLSYPFGRYNRAIMQLAEKAGYEAAYATGLSMRQRYCLERFEVKPGDGWLSFGVKSSIHGSWLRSIYNVNSKFLKETRKMLDVERE